jgi:UDP-N-acetylglucosamine acyltransferase
MMMISPLSNIHPDAKLGKDVTVEAFTTIEADVIIGDEPGWTECNYFQWRDEIGKDCRIFPGAVIAAIPQDLKYKGENTVVEIGDNCTIREMVTVNKGTAALGKTVLGKNCLLMAYVHIAHDCLVGDHVILANSVNLAGHVTIEEYAILEGLCRSFAIYQNRCAQFYRRTNRSAEKCSSLYQSRSRTTFVCRCVNSVGLKTSRFRQCYRSAFIQDIYRILYTKGFSTRNAIDIIEKEIPSAGVKDQIIEFIRTSDKGIMRGYSVTMKNELRHGLTRIILKDIGKKFRGRWIFKNVNLEIAQGERIAVTGSNGSGKSHSFSWYPVTTIPSEGSITWMNETEPLPVDSVFRHLAFPRALHGSD